MKTIERLNTTWTPSLGVWKEGDTFRTRLWAPKASKVEWVADFQGQPAKAVEMTRDADGFFSAPIPGVKAGDWYRYRIDGKTLVPDPVSRFQPDGVHKASMVVDPKAFTWTDGQWKGIVAERLVVYELHIGTFTPQGTFLAAIEKFDLLKELGVTAIEIMPVADFPGDRNWGYDGVDLFSPARCYGSPDDLRRLVDASHARGLSVILDVVYNHLGPDGNYVNTYSQSYFTDKHKSPWGAGVNLDGPQSQPVRAFFTENAQHWIHEYHIDGLRLDATHAIIDDSPRHFLAELAQKLRETSPGKPIYLIAEDHRNMAQMISPEHDKGWGLDAVWSDDFHHEMRRLLAGDHEAYFAKFTGTVADVAKTIEQGWFHNDPGGLPLWKYVICLQNHDQIGNRAMGERLNHQIDAASYRAASAVLLFSPEMPMLFMGQEWAASTPFQFFTDHNAELGKLITKGRREEFKSFSTFADPKVRAKIPDPQARSTFENSRLKWDERTAPEHQGHWNLYKALLNLRQSEPALTDAGREGLRVQALSDQVLCIRRAMGGEELMLVAALRGAATVDAPDLSEAWKEILQTESGDFATGSDAKNITVSGAKITFERPGAILFKRSKGAA